MIHSNEQFGVSVAYSSAEPAHFPPIICSTVSEHVFLTCHDCPISWNRFCRRTLFRHRLLPRAGAACKGGNYASFDASCRCYPAAILLLAAGVLLVPAANAQVQSPPGLSEQPPNISDQKLDAAAAAIERVASLKQDYQQRIAAAAPSDKERIANEAINVLAKAITDQGLSVEEYDSILDVAQNDPEVREKIRQRIRPSAR
jgi:hypothetical protein